MASPIPPPNLDPIKNARARSKLPPERRAECHRCDGFGEHVHVEWNGSRYVETRLHCSLCDGTGWRPLSDDEEWEKLETDIEMLEAEMRYPRNRFEAWMIEHIYRPLLRWAKAYARRKGW